MVTKHMMLFLLLFLLTGAGWAETLPGGWESREAGVRALLVSSSFADQRNGWACGICNITHTTNGGKTWQAQWTRNGQESYWFNNIVALSPTVALVSGFPYGRQGGGVVLRTEDGGVTWTAIHVSDDPLAAYSSLVFRRDGRTGFVISSTTGLLGTRDGGLTWSPVKLPSSPTRIWVATRCNISLPENSTTILVGGDTALVRSTDDGKNWDVLPLPEGITNPHRQFSRVYFSTPEHGWVSLLAGDTLETTDGGQHWTKSKAPGAVFLQDAKSGFALSQYEVFQTRDSGVTWEPGVKIGSGLWSLVSLAFTGTRAVVVGGDEGTGTSFIADHGLPGAANTALPTGVVPISFTMPAAGYATIQVLNDHGDVVQNVATAQSFTAGKQTVWWDLSTIDDFWPPFTKSKPFLWEPPKGVPMVATPGTYRWRGIWHPAFSLEYKYSYYPLREQGLAWISADLTGGWLGDHQAPQDVVRTGGTMWVGAFNEAGHCLLEADTAMKKRWGSTRIELSCPKVLAADGENVYFVEEGGWLGFAGQQVTGIVINRTTKAARRLFAIGNDEKRSAGEEVKGVSGLTVRGSRAWIACRETNMLLECDLTDNLSGKSLTLKVVNAIPLLKPGRLRPYDARRLAAVSDTRIVLIDMNTRQITPVVTGLVNPLGLAVDALGLLYVGEMEPVHQVKVFTPDGKLQRVIGKPGQHRIGPFDPQNLESPAGLEVDALGNLWVCEANDALRRTSVWDQQGKYVHQVLGSAIYGSGATGIDPDDANRLFYNGQEFRRDPKTGVIRLVNLIWRYDDPRYDRFVEQRPHNFGGPCPSYPFRRDGKLYFSLWGGYSMGEVTTLWVYDHDQVRPVAACGKIPDWLRTRLGDATQGMRIFAWTDANDDGRVQPNEVQLGALADGGAVWGVRMNQDFEVAFSTVLGDVGVAFFHAARRTAQGYPVWTLPTAYTMAPNLRTWDPNQVQTVYSDRQGNAVLISPYLLSLRPDGVVNWRYPCRWPGLHAGMNTTASGLEPGVLIAPLRCYGSGVVNDEVGEVLCFGTDFGATDLLTADGLYLGRVYQDCRRADAWTFNQPPTPQQLSTVSLGGEHFGGSFQRVKDTDGLWHFRYVGAGDNVSCNVTELTGLEAAHRLPGENFTVTARQWQNADRLRQQRATEVLEPKRATITRLAQVTIDGKATEWPAARVNGFALGYDNTNLYLYYEGEAGHPTFQNAATAGNFAEAFKHGDVVDVLLETKAGANPDRQDAAQGDLRVSFTLVDGAPAAILYDYVAPGTPAAQHRTFSSPWQTVEIDRVVRLPEAQIAITHDATHFTLEAAVPLTSLHLDPAKMPTLKGDFGIVVSDQTGTRTIDRRYWSNPNTKIISDLPSEARIQPDLWGTLVFEKKD